MRDIFDFWSNVPGDARKHPADEVVFDRALNGEDQGHGFDLRCIPTPFYGRLRTAPVVLLYLSPGWNQLDVEEANDSTAQARYQRARQGNTALEGEGEHAPRLRWWTERTKRLGQPNELRDNLAVLNISAYHSVGFKDDALLAALPSCRAALDWAQSVLFPQAERGERVVVCMRSAKFWGLGQRRRYGEALFAPAVGRGGHMIGTGENMTVRDDVVSAVRKVIAREPFSN